MRIIEEIGNWATRAGNELLRRSGLQPGEPSPTSPESSSPRQVANQLAEQILQEYRQAQQHETFDRDSFLEEIQQSSLFQKLRQLGKKSSPPVSPGPDFEWLTIVDYDAKRHRLFPGQSAHASDPFLLLLPHFQSQGGVIPDDFRAVVVSLNELQKQLQATLSSRQDKDENNKIR